MNKGSESFVASITLSPNPRGLADLARIGIVCITINIVIPITSITKFPGRITLFAISLRSNSGDRARLSTKINPINEDIPRIAKEIVIIVE